MSTLIKEKGPSIGTIRDKEIPAFIMTGDDVRYTFHRMAAEDTPGSMSFDLETLADDERLLYPGLIYKKTENIGKVAAHKTVIQVEILSSEPYDPESLAQVHYDGTEGDNSMSWKIISTQGLTREEAEEALRWQGSDPDFLFGHLNEEG